MEPRDAQLLERKRGYADIDPERAFEHWELLRQHGGTVAAGGD
jgi:hypothetical protein